MCRGAVAEGAVRPHLIIVFAPILDQIPSLSPLVEELAVEQFITQLAIERFVVAIFPGTAGLDIQGFNLDALQPAAHHASSKFVTG
jgi:hypothetical protein